MHYVIRYNYQERSFAKLVWKQYYLCRTTLRLDSDIEIEFTRNLDYARQYKTREEAQHDFDILCNYHNNGDLQVVSIG